MQKIKRETELHIIVENETGILGRILSTLANAGLNLRALSVYTEGNKGHFHIISSDNRKAEKALKSLGYKVSVGDVITILIDDRIGAGAEVGALLGNAVIDVEYCYCTSAGSGQALLVFRTNDNKKAYETLR
ncbi:MAG: ACT domain-containing protein [Candidatus Aminicenantales bacterium]